MEYNEKEKNKCLFFSLGYIGWKPGRQFQSRFRMDGSVVCTQDTIPHTIGINETLIVLKLKSLI